MDPMLKGKTAIVTGAGRGIGRGIALCLAREGADVAIGDIDLKNAEAVAVEVRAKGRKALAVQSDVGTRRGAEALVEAALKAFGNVDILVNNAGVVGAKGWQDRPIPSDDDWAEVLRVNRGLQGSSAIPHYCASKAADINYTQSLALMLAPFNINANAILPGMLLTDMLKGIYDQGTLRGRSGREMSHDEIYKMSIANIPLGRGQGPEDIGNMAVFLASDLAKNVTAQAIDVDGGFRMH
ncbi:MAG: SDR family oxidoreductase [Chloroflexi bacterium]|nr:SDR family oxidoreductase [Chloroflexota bacterium]